MADPTIVFLPSGLRGTVEPGSTVLEAARMLGVDVDSVCGGRGICGRCQVDLGSTPATPNSPEALSPPASLEADYRGKRPLEGRRLACAARVIADVVIGVPPDSAVHRQVVRKRAEVLDIAIDPVVRLYLVEPATETVEAVLEALAREWEVAGITATGVGRSAIERAWQGGRQMTVAVHDATHLTTAWAGFHDTMAGIAFDVGSTTIAAHLCDIATGQVLQSAARMNPQIRFGEDLMSRVSYCMMNEGGAARLTEAVRGALAEMAAELIEGAGLELHDVLEVTVVGNPIMHHLVLGLDPTPLGVAPFTLAVREALRLEAADVGLRLNPGARLYVLPCIAGHVGADAVAAALSEGPQRSAPVQLLVDVGTNAEIMFGNQDRLLAASSPTGPAFEGAQISSGQRAAPGAIESVRIDRETLEPRFRVIGVDQWSDEAGFEAAAESVGVSGICGSGIIEVIAELYLAGVIDADGVLGDAESWRVRQDGRTFEYVLVDGSPPISVTQPDVRAIQLAKAALYAGIQLLMDRFGVYEVDEIRLAGAFGAHLDPVYAMTLGLIPDCDPDRVYAAGNAAGTGAMMALLSGKAREAAEALAAGVEKVETATEPAFQRHFVEAMAIPHRVHTFPRLGRVVDLPLPPIRTAGGRRTSRRRGRQ